MFDELEKYFGIKKCIRTPYHPVGNGMVERLTLSWRRLLSYRNQSIDLWSKSMDWFLYDNGLRYERVKLNIHAYASHIIRKIGI